MKNINKLVRKQILEMKEINWGEIPDDNPYRLLWGENQQSIEICKKAIIKEIEKINLYPSVTKTKLKEKISRYNNVEIKNIAVTNGSDEAIELITKTFISEGDEIVLPVPSFPVYESTALVMEAKINKIFLKKDFSLDFEKLLKAVNSKTKIIWIGNPNNPTGNILLTKKQIESLAKNINCLLVIDECYFELSGISAVSLIKKYSNIIILRSFSKVFALAGLRLGYIISSEQIITYLNRVQQSNQPFNVNRFAQTAGLAIMSKPQLIKTYTANFIKLKSEFEKQLKKIDLNVLPTQTTFCLVKLPEKITGKKLKEKLAKQNIFIKDCSIYEGLGSQFIYLGIPKKEYQKFCLQKIKGVLEELSC